MRQEALEWLAALPHASQAQAAENLGLAAGYERRIARMRKMVARIRSDAERSGGMDGVAFADIRDVHRVLLPPDTMTSLVAALRNGLNNFASLLSGSVRIVAPSTVASHFETGVRLTALVESVGPALWGAMDSGSIDAAAMHTRVVAAVDDLWNTHAVAAIHSERTRFAVELAYMRRLRNMTFRLDAESAERQARAALACARAGDLGGFFEGLNERSDLKPAALAAIVRVEQKLSAPVDCASWHGVRIASEGVPIVGPAGHAPLRGQDGARPHVSACGVEVEGIAIPVVQMAHALRLLVHRRFLRADLLSVETMLRLVSRDIDRFARTLASVVEDLGEGFQVEWVQAAEEEDLQRPPSPAVGVSSPPPSTCVEQDPLFRQIDLQARLSSAQGPFDRAVLGLQTVTENLEVSYAAITTTMAALSGYPRRSTRVELQTTDIIGRTASLLAKVGRDYSSSSLVQRLAALFKNLADHSFGEVRCTFERGRSNSLVFAGLNVVDQACLALSDLLRAIENGGDVFSGQQTKRFRKRNKRARDEAQESAMAPTASKLLSKKRRHAS